MGSKEIEIMSPISATEWEAKVMPYLICIKNEQSANNRTIQNLEIFLKHYMKKLYLL